MLSTSPTPDQSTSSCSARLMELPYLSRGSVRCGSFGRIPNTHHFLRRLVSPPGLKNSCSKGAVRSSWGHGERRDLTMVCGLPSCMEEAEPAPKRLNVKMWSATRPAGAPRSLSALLSPLQRVYSRWVYITTEGSNIENPMRLDADDHR